MDRSRKGMLTLLKAIFRHDRKLTDGELIDVAMAVDAGTIGHLKDSALMQVAQIANFPYEVSQEPRPVGLVDSTAADKLAPIDNRSASPITTPLQIILRWADHALDVIRVQGFGFSAELVPTRSLGSSQTPNVVTFVPDGESGNAPTLRVAKRSGKRFDLFVDELSQNVVSGRSRVTLRRGDKELSSLVWNGDSIRFANIGAGSYSITLDPPTADSKCVFVTLTES